HDDVVQYTLEDVSHELGLCQGARQVGTRLYHLRRISARRVMTTAATHQRASTSRSRPVASNVSEARPARSRSAPAWTGRNSWTVWNHCGSWLAGKVMGEKSITKKTSTWESSWATIGLMLTAIA